MDEKKRKLLLVLVALLVLGIIGVQSDLDPKYAKLNKSDMKSGDRGELMVQLPGQFIVATFAGFQEVIAGALWVRADEFFHKGDYQAIVPIIRLVTWLDPHNVQVYFTGAWHLDYNFTDKNERSDKRYIASSVALLKECIANNPTRWDTYFELANTHYDRKLNDSFNALKYYKLACEHEGVDPNTGEIVDRPEFVGRVLAQSYQDVGDYNGAEKQWKAARKYAVDIHDKLEKNNQPANDTEIQVCDYNLIMFYLRNAWRYGDMKSYAEGIKLCKTRTTSIAKWAIDGAVNDYNKRLASGNYPKDALKPLDTKFEITWKKIAPRIIEVKGKIDLIKWSEYKDLASEVFTHAYQNNMAIPADKRSLWRDGCRVRWQINDLGYKLPELESFSWKKFKYMDKELKREVSPTITWDSFYVRNGEFHGKIDLTDTEINPLEVNKYKLTFYFTPQESGCPENVQDRIGIMGEALADKNYLQKEKKPPYKVLKKEIILSKSDII